ncbi:Holliday junction resolvase RuvX [Patescibacteria group bacterium]|nr:Holliday junction resolvase RuvX [Patescibacteria group bacterium]
MRILGIDYGTKKIGLALSDESGRFAFPHSTIYVKTTKPSFVAKIKEVCEENKVGKIILGRPMGYKGDAREILKKIEKFKIILENKIGLPIVYENEVLTTRQAKRPIEVGRPRGHLSKNVRSSTSNIKKIDASAAALILQSFLEKN